jgi:hypothetical protein
VLAYAEDHVLLAPSWRALQSLLDLLLLNIVAINITCNVNKSVCMVFNQYSNTWVIWFVMIFLMIVILGARFVVCSIVLICLFVVFFIALYGSRLCYLERTVSVCMIPLHGNIIMQAPFLSWHLAKISAWRLFSVLNAEIALQVFCCISVYLVSIQFCITVMQFSKDATVVVKMVLLNTCFL